MCQHKRHKEKASITNSVFPKQCEKHNIHTIGRVIKIDTMASTLYHYEGKKRCITMTRGTKNQLKYLLFVFFLLTFSFHGCAHQNNVIPSHKALEESSHHHNEINVFALNQPQSKQGEIQEYSLDGSFDFFDKDDEEEVIQIADPFSVWNRAMFHFNDKLYFWALKPLARGYKAVIPTPARIGVKNFFHNLAMPIRMVSCLLQGKGRAASGELSRFLINSTVGILGFGNPAKNWTELNPSQEDVGQALASYGIGNGFYIVWPFLGPSTLRDTLGLVGDWFLYPVSYVDPIEKYLQIWTFEMVNKTSFSIGDYESLKEATIDPYVAFRDAYIQNRKKKVQE